MKYKKNYIKSIVLRVDFEKILNFDKEKFQNSYLKELYPTEKMQQKTDYVTTISREKQSIEKIDYSEYRYYDDTSKNCFCISENFIFFELQQYVSYEELKKQFIEIFNILKNNYNIASFIRVGLRYINDLKFEGDNLKKYISKNLLSNNSFVKDINKERKKNKEAVLSEVLTLGRVSLKNNDTDSIVNFIFGNPNRYYPAINTDINFLLDYDSFINNVHRDDLLDKLDALHANVVFLFEISITDDLRIFLNEQNKRE